MGGDGVREACNGGVGGCGRGGRFNGSGGGAVDDMAARGCRGVDGTSAIGVVCGAGNKFT